MSKNIFRAALWLWGGDRLVVHTMNSRLGLFTTRPQRRMGLTTNTKEALWLQKQRKQKLANQKLANQKLKFLSNHFGGANTPPCIF